MALPQGIEVEGVDFGDFDKVNEIRRLSKPSPQPSEGNRDADIQPLELSDMEFGPLQINDEGAITGTFVDTSITGNVSFNIVNTGDIPFGRLSYSDLRFGLTNEDGTIASNYLEPSDGTVGLVRRGQGKTISLDFDIGTEDIPGFWMFFQAAIWNGLDRVPLKSQEMNAGGDVVTTFPKKIEANLSSIVGFNKDITVAEGSFKAGEVEFVEK